MLDRKFIMTLCFLGYFWHRALMACTTTTWSQEAEGDRSREGESTKIKRGFKNKSEAEG